LVNRAWTTVPTTWLERDVYLLAVGKAAVGMARAVSELAGPNLRDALVIAPAPGATIDGLKVLGAGHPVPTEASEAAGRRALAFAAARRPGDRLIVLLSGGASALMAVPADGLTLEDKAATTRHLLRGGAAISSLNAVRKHLSAVKGGRLASVGQAKLLTLAISDVIGDDLSVIGSGPTVADSSTFHDAARVLRDVGEGLGSWPSAVIDRLAAGVAGTIPETPKPGDPRLEGHDARVIGGRRDAMDGAAREAQRRGYQTVIVDEPVEGEARVTAPVLLDTALSTIHRMPSSAPVCLVRSGETTVHVVGHGIGGRNQELVLASIERLAALEWPVAFASVGTDGIDGPTPAAGAIADSESVARARAERLPAPAEFLGRNDAYRFFEALNDLVVTGPTGTNVGDLQIFLIAPRTGTSGAAHA
jgi:hydroxypyruvate reductase